MLKRWTFFEKNDTKNWTFFEHDSENWIFSYDSNNWALFLKLTHRIEFFYSCFKYWVFFFEKNTQRIERIEPILVITQRIELFLLKIWLKELNFFLLNLTQRIVPSFFSWFKYLDLFHMTRRIEPSFYVTQNTWIFFENFWFKEMDPFFFLKTQSFFIKKKLTE